jgi:hypothetical protein
MPVSVFFQLECDPVEPDDAPSHIIYSCLQWKGPNLKSLSQAYEQKFCLMYPENIDERLISALEQAYIQGAMSPVKLITAHDDHIHLFLDSTVSSSTLTAIESLWMSFCDIDPHRLYAVSFSSETDIYSGRTDYPYWSVAKGILESHVLGIMPYKSPNFDYGDNMSLDEDWELFPLSRKNHSGIYSSA